MAHLEGTNTVKAINRSALVLAAVIGLFHTPSAVRPLQAEDDFFDQADNILVNGQQAPTPAKDPVPNDGSNLQWWEKGTGATKQTEPAKRVAPKPTRRSALYPVRRSSTATLHRPSREQPMISTAKPPRQNPLQGWNGKVGGAARRSSLAASTAGNVQLRPVPQAEQLSPRSATQQLAWWQEDGQETGSKKDAPSKAAIQQRVNETVNNPLFNQTIGDIGVSIALPPNDPDMVPATPESRAVEMPNRPGWMKEFQPGFETTRIPVGMHYCFYSRPLYYEDANLERCGYSMGLYQNLVSAAHFVSTTAMLPYHIGANPPPKCVWGKGDCPQCSVYSFEDNYLPQLSEDGTWLQAGAITGLFFLIP